jgi:hypothetical protein
MCPKYWDRCKFFYFGYCSIIKEPESFTSYSKTVKWEFWQYIAEIAEIVSNY